MKLKMNILKGVLIFLLIFLLPFLLTLIINRSSSTSAIPDPANYRICYQSYDIELDFDTYLLGTIAASTPIGYQPEFLKAQAIICRTYALKNLATLINEDPLIDFSSEKPAFLTSELGLPYIDPDTYFDALDKNGQSAYYEEIKTAIKETDGIVITYKHDLITPLYFSVSNGATRDASKLWDARIPYLKSVSSEQDIQSSDYMKITTVTVSSVIELLNTAYQAHELEASSYDYQLYTSLPLTQENFFTAVQVLTRDETGYVLTIDLGGVAVSGEAFASALGLNSSCFSIEEYESNVRFIVNGKGHGLGFSQYGANALAREGKTYEELLSYYYSKIKLTKI